MSKFSRLDIDWSKFRWRIIEVGNLFEEDLWWEFNTQEEAHEFVENAKIYNPEFDFWWELVRND